MFITLTHAVQKNNIDMAFNNVSFINFNYDRCLEFYLKHALMGVFTCDENIADEAIRKINILHPYGQVGFLPGIGGGGTVLDFGGSEHDHYDALRVSDEIITYTETISDTTLLAKIRLTMEESEQIIFLGFGFHAQNMKLLATNRDAFLEFKTVLATAVGVSRSNADIIEKKLRFISYPLSNAKNTTPQILIEREMDCSKILSDYELLIRS